MECVGLVKARSEKRDQRQEEKEMEGDVMCGRMEVRSS